MSKIKFKTGEEYYNKIYIFFNASVAITLLPLAILLLQQHRNELIPIQVNFWTETGLTSLLIIVGGLLVYKSVTSYRFELEQISKHLNLRSKLNTYYSIGIKKFMRMMLPCGIFVTGYFIFVNPLFIVGYVVTMIFLSLKRPTLNLLISELQLDDQQKKTIIENLEIE